MRSANSQTLDVTSSREVMLNGDIYADLCAFPGNRVGFFVYFGLELIRLQEVRVIAILKSARLLPGDYN